MAAFRVTRNSLLLAHDQILINEEEFILLYKINTSNNLKFCYWKYASFNLENISTLDISTVLAISFFVLKLFPYILFDDEIKLTNFFTYVLPTEYRKKAYLHFKLLLTNI